MAKRKPIPKTIYFTNGHATDEDYAAADELDNAAGVVFRRGDLIVPADPLEEFDFVAGDVPANYAAEAERRAAEADPDAVDAPKADASGVAPTSPVAPLAPVVPPKAPGKASAWKPNA